MHHDPVFKHRAQQVETPSSGNSTRGRRGRGGSGTVAPPKGPGNGTHEITEDVRNALAQIAKSTVHPHAAEHTEEPAPVGTAPAATVVEAPVEILDIPVARAPRAARRTSPKEAEQLLGSVLEALPEPKQPGEGRSRRGSRRASTSGVVTPPAENS